MDNMFEQATKLKLRFAHNGVISIEDLWDLNLNALNDIAKKVNSELKKVDGEEDFITGESAESTERTVLQLKLDILKHVIKFKLELREAAKLKREEAERKSKIVDILARKQDAALENMSEEELRKLL